MKKFIIVVILLLFLGWLFLDDEEKDITNSGEKTITLMIYMCASDLESDGGYATDDIDEILKGTTPASLNFFTAYSKVFKYLSS